jgi:acyl-coenzyme A synthetase/AMP-(fatty) acid ligase
MSYFERIIDELAKRSNRVLFDDDCGNEVTYKEFVELVESRVKQLRQLVSSGDAVLVSSGRGLTFFVDMFAVWLIGAIFVPYAADIESDNLQLLAEISKAKLLLSADSRKSITISQVIDGELVKPLRDGAEYANRNSDEVFSILFTSGSTGVPKGVALSADALIGNSRAVLNTLEMAEGDRFFINIPFNFTSAICHFLAVALSGSTMIGVEKRCFAKDFLAVFDRKKIDGFGGAPVQLRWLAECFSSSAYADSFESLKYVISSGDVLQQDIIERFVENRPGISVYTIYGLTEVGGRFCILEPSELPESMGSVGKPIRGLSVQIFDPDSDAPMKADEVGEIVANGDYLFAEYWNNPDKTAEALTGVGFRTGDLGYIDGHGNLWVTGRKDDVFKVNGVKVSGARIEVELMRTNLFKDVSVMSKDYGVFGVLPVAFYSTEDGSNVSKGDALRLIREKLPTNHLPHEFIRVDEIPRTGSGKVQRHYLRDMI